MQDFMFLFRFVAGHYGFMILMGLVSYIIGLRLTKRLTYDSVLEEISICASLGLGMIAYLIFVLGMLGLLYKWVVLFALGACVAGCYPVMVQVGQRMLSAIRRATLSAKALLIAAGVALSVPFLLLPLYPPTQFDATSYFLASSKIYVQRHGVVLTPYLRFPVLVQLNEMLFTLALLLYDDIAAQIFQFLMLLILLLSVIAFCRRTFSMQAGWWAAGLLLANPLVLWCASVGYVDMSLVLFSSIAAYTFWNWFHSRQGHWLLLSGVFCGFAASTKYPGIFFPLLFGIVTVVIAVRERKFSIPLRLAAATLVTAGPWYLRNFYYTRNPIFPFLPQVFGYSLWSAEDVLGLIGDMQLHGVGRSWSALLWLPWHLAFNQDVFLSHFIHLSQLYFFALPLLVVCAVMDVRIRKILGLALVFTLFFFLSSQVLRYLLPALPALSIALAASLDMLLGWTSFTRKWRSRWIVIAFFFAVFAYGGWKYSVITWYANGPIPVTQQQRDAYITNHLGSYPAYKLLNDKQGSRYTLYGLLDENMAYFAQGANKGDHFGPARYSRLWDKLGDGKLLYSELKSMEADYFLVNTSRLKIQLPEDGFFRSHFKPLYETSTVHLFELTTDPFERKVGALLQNPGFEELKDSQPAGWYLAGRPIVDASGKQSFKGQAAILCNQAGDVIYQELTINSGERYFFSCEAHAVKDQGNAKLQFNWYDKQGRVLKEEIKIFKVGVDWTLCEMSVQAPAEATSVTAYASLLDPGPVWFDEFSFGAMTYESLPKH